MALPTQLWAQLVGLARASEFSKGLFCAHLVGRWNSNGPPDDAHAIQWASRGPRNGICAQLGVRRPSMTTCPLPQQEAPGRGIMSHCADPGALAAPMTFGARGCAHRHSLRHFRSLGGQSPEPSGISRSPPRGLSGSPMLLVTVYLGLCGPLDWTPALRMGLLRTDEARTFVLGSLNGSRCPFRGFSRAQ